MDNESDHASIINLGKFYGLNTMMEDICPKTFIFDKKYKVDWSSVYETDGTSADPTLICYTDGSLFQDTGSSGYGIWIQNGDISIYRPLGRHATVFQAEVMAILDLVDMLTKHGVMNHRIAILSDSQAALKALNSHCANSALIRECQSKLNTLGGNNDIELHWVKGHSGEEGNERADELARLGSSTPYIGAEPAVGISPTVIKSMISSACRTIHDDLWASQDSCWQTKSLAPGRNAKYAHNILRLPRKQLRTLLCLITGHGGFKNHLHRMGLTMDRICPLCEEELDTASH
jgi:ribonuclease HI